MILVTSWDDGAPSDIKLAGLLSKYSIKGTFYVPIRNREGRPVIGSSELRDLLNGGFEIGSHTLDHAYLTDLSETDARGQIRRGKAMLEDAVGQTILGFCYPGGRKSSLVRNIVRQEGFSYARTTVNFSRNIGVDPFSMPTTLQYYPHSRDVLTRNFIRHGKYLARAAAYQASITTSTIAQRVLSMLSTYSEPDQVFHVWGHSWEIEERNLWRELEESLALLSQASAKSLTVAQAAKLLV